MENSSSILTDILYLSRSSKVSEWTVDLFYKLYSWILQYDMWMSQHKLEKERDQLLQETLRGVLPMIASKRMTQNHLQDGTSESANAVVALDNWDAHRTFLFQLLINPFTSLPIFDQTLLHYNPQYFLQDVVLATQTIVEANLLLQVSQQLLDSVPQGPNGWPSHNFLNDSREFMRNRKRNCHSYNPLNFPQKVAAKALIAELGQLQLEGQHFTKVQSALTSLVTSLPISMDIIIAAFILLQKPDPIFHQTILPSSPNSHDNSSMPSLSSIMESWLVHFPDKPTLFSSDPFLLASCCRYSLFSLFPAYLGSLKNSLLYALIISEDNTADEELQDIISRLDHLLLFSSTSGLTQEMLSDVKNNAKDSPKCKSFPWTIFLSKIQPK